MALARRASSSLCDLGDDELYLVLLRLPCVTRFQCSVLNKRFAALLRSSRAYARIDFSLYYTHGPGVWHLLLQKAGTELREVDATGMYHRDDDTLTSAVSRLLPAQREVLTVLRCTGGNSITTLAEVRSVVQHCPRLATLAVEVYTIYLEELVELITTCPQLCIEEAHVAGTLENATSADVQTLLRRCAKLFFSSVLDASSLQLVQTALQAVPGAVRCARVFLVCGSLLDAAELAHPHIASISRHWVWDDEPAGLSDLCTQLVSPACALRRLSLAGIKWAQTLAPLSLALERGARLEVLFLHFIRANHQVIDEDEDDFAAVPDGEAFSRLCCAMAKSPWLHTINLHEVGNWEDAEVNSGAVVAMVAASSTLRKFSLIECGLSNVHLAALLLAIQGSRLVTLEIGETNMVHADATNALAQLLAHNRSLCDVSIVGAHFTLPHDTIETVLKAARGNTVLQHLALPSFDNEFLLEMLVMKLRNTKQLPSGLQVRRAEIYGLEDEQ